MCKESLINDENWKNAYTKGYVLRLIIGGARPPLLKYWGGQWPPWPPLFLLHWDFFSCSKQKIRIKRRFEVRVSLQNEIYTGGLVSESEPVRLYIRMY